MPRHVARIPRNLVSLFGADGRASARRPEVAKAAAANVGRLAVARVAPSSTASPLPNVLSNKKSPRLPEQPQAFRPRLGPWAIIRLVGAVDVLVALQEPERRRQQIAAVERVGVLPLAGLGAVGPPNRDVEFLNRLPILGLRRIGEDGGRNVFKPEDGNRFGR